MLHEVSCILLLDSLELFKGKMNENLARRAQLEWKLWDYLHISFRREAESGWSLSSPEVPGVAGESILLLRNWWFTLKPCGFLNTSVSLCVNQSGIQKHTSLK